MANIEDVAVAPGANAFGHAHLFREQRLPLFRAIGKTAGISRVKFLFRNVMFANTPATAHEVLVEKAKSFEKSPGIRLLLHYLAGQGLFTSEGELWKQQRRLMAPLFAPNVITRHGIQMHDVARRIVSTWREGQSIDLARETTRIAMAIVGKALFDSDTFDESDELGEALTKSLGWVDENAGSVMLIPHIYALDVLDDVEEKVPPALRDLQKRMRAAADEPFLLDGARSPELRAAISRLDRKIQEMIDERRSKPGGTDLLAKLLSARDDENASFKGMSDKQVRDEAVTLFVAGHETTATSLAWAFYLLARNPDWRARVQAEVDALPPGPIDFTRAAKLDLTLRVFKEAMRLYPPVELLPRRTLEETTVGGVRMPPRTIVMVSPWIVHRDPQTWPDPERFDPDRFLPAVEATRPKSSWLPFGGGPRVCLGNHFAMLEGPIVLATLMRHARFEIDEQREIREDTFATLRPRGGVPAVVRLRDS